MGPFVLALEFSEVMGTVFAGKREAGRAELGEEGRSWGSGRRLSPAPPALARLPPPLENILCQLPLTMWQHCLVRGGGVYLWRVGWGGNSPLPTPEGNALLPIGHRDSPVRPPTLHSLPPALCFLDPILS